MKALSWKSNIKHAKLEYLIKELDSAQEMSRGGITNRAVTTASIITNEFNVIEKKDYWTNITKKLPELNAMNLEVSVPSAMQVKIEDDNEDDFTIIFEEIRVSLELEVLQTQYLVQILWMSYYLWLKNNAFRVGTKEQDSISGPDMVKKLVQILLLNRESDKKIIDNIKESLLEWEE